MIYTVTLNPALDKTVEIPGLALDTVNRITRMRTDPGGKGINVSKVIAKLGGSSKAIGILAGDSGHAIQAALNREKLPNHFRFVEGETRTNLKIIDPKNHTNTDINEPGIEVSENDLTILLNDLLTELRSGDIVVLAGSLPKGAPKDTYYTWGDACKNTGAKVFLDADGALLAEGLKAGPYLVKPNNDELSRMMGRELKTLDELADAGQTLIRRGIEHVVVSMGGRGALYLHKDSVIYAPALKVKVGSTVGAGDSVVAALAYAEAQGLTEEQTVRLSTATGAANVMCSGTQAAERSIIEDLIPSVTFQHL